MNINSKDLNLIYLFQVIFEEQSVSGAAERLNISQPALSHRLAKLRSEFGDVLFARSSRGLTPSPRAYELAPHVNELMRAIQSFYDYCDEQNFLLRKDRVHIFSTDYVEQLLLPKLLPVVSNNAPNLQLVMHNTRGKLPRNELETGECDLAIAGFFTQLPDTFYQQKIHTEPFSVLASRSNKKIGKELTLETFLSCEHLVTTLTGDLNGIVDKVLEGQGLKRKITAGVSSFLSPSAIIRDSDMIVTCLRSIAEQACQEHEDLVNYPSPVELPNIDIRQIWHTRTHNDPLRAWLRKQIQLILE